MKTENLKKAYEAIKSGKIIDCNGCWIWAGPMCYRGGEPYGKRQALCYRYFGQSATSMSLSWLRWIMKQIAGSVDYQFNVVESIY